MECSAAETGDPREERKGERTMTVSDFFQYLKPGKRAHLVGIGGVSMSPLAEVFKLRGLTVQGSDINDSEVVRGLRADGIPVFIGHRPENVAGADFLVRTAAVHDDNPEIKAAREAGIPVFERTQAWGAIMKDYACGVCVAGAHGKTTTTSMLTHILMEAGKDPTVMIGGTLPLIGSGYRVGHGDTILLESCEYYDSFLNCSPTVAVILNVDNDHLDYFGTLENIKKSFRAFAELTPEKGGWVISCADDANTEDTLAGIARRRLRYGFAPDADTMCATPWPPAPRQRPWGWTPRPWRRGSAPSGAQSGGRNTRANAAGPTCTTTTPTTPVNSGPSWTR